ncbi:hypothetical protein CROQUDRAFT_628142 [Cronartium quercuum f. sp. fusiforme G11]|uniref:Secreted protein n=1 Tax=Cronartium quercuum f. sp. fusiforme G11 TaxID=708437 RepID=A0A9P6NX22_9BASI|nr:hypothetical protein CROQUDRAFT_628142 [Cronartium quercuum f. sp. fusiforme G11]
MHILCIIFFCLSLAFQVCLCFMLRAKILCLPACFPSALFNCFPPFFVSRTNTNHLPCQLYGVWCKSVIFCIIFFLMLKVRVGLGILKRYGMCGVDCNVESYFFLGFCCSEMKWIR